MRSVQRIRKVGIVPLYQPQHNFILNYIRKQGARTKMGIFNAKDKYNVESRLQQMGWTVPDFDLPTMKEGTKFAFSVLVESLKTSNRRTKREQKNMFYYGEKDECLVQVLKEWKEISEKDRRIVSLIKPENMHIVSARLFLESAIPRENALCAEIYMRSIILCELEEKPTYVTLPEDADIYLYGFAIDFVYEYARNEDGKMTFSEPEWKIQNIRNWPKILPPKK